MAVRRVVTFVGLNGAGNISVASAKAGDIVAFLVETGGTGSTFAASAAGSFASFILTDGELYQNSGSDLSGLTFTALLD
jgi:hypothetical protein